GFGLNAVNSVALDILLGWGMKSQTLSVELSSDRIEKLSHIIPFSLIVYGRIPLMRFRACPVQASLGCKKCKGKGFLKDRFGNVFPVECSNKTSSSLLNSVPVYIGDKKKLVSDAQIFWFTVENKQDIDRVMDEFQKKDVPIFERTTGLYFREVF
ncbi:MAG: hypothetical protein IJ091_10955, partial [Oscillospiraceae bacterium]|nr:hypothetical protein [Oscillospiraceae bacterium]